MALNVDQYDRSCGIEISQNETQIIVIWPIGGEQRARFTFDLADERPLLNSIDISTGGKPFQSIATALDPTLLIRVGQRDLAKREGWTIFFDRMQTKPSELFLASVKRNKATATSKAQRATLSLGEVTAGPFSGELRWTFYAGNPFVLQEAIVQTSQDKVAFLYDTGLVFRENIPDQLFWRSSTDVNVKRKAAYVTRAENLAVHGRAICAQSATGSIALFPPPHRYFYPLDFSDNLKNVWIGPNYGKQQLPFGMGVRHEPSGDNRYVPWFNAPPGTRQHLGLFLYVSGGTGEQTYDKIARLTRNDRFAPLSGHTVFSSHYHVEHTQQLLEAQGEEDGTESATAQLTSGRTYRIPERLKQPGFVRVFRQQGIDIVHLAEFHFGRTPRMPTDERIRHLEFLHAECQRLSDDQFLLLPGEEPNVHLGGHWISFFPKPVYWVLNRPRGTPFVTEHPKLGKIYHVGSKADVLQLLKTESGLAWTAHPRIKGSTGYPDRYRNELFYRSDRFLGAAWKAMPADLSRQRMGWRVLDLLDDMANWGDPKYVLGEVDVFKIEPDHELYGHMNVNYLRLEKAPRFEDGWQTVLDTLRDGQFFVTTGEILIPRFTVNERPSGEVATLSPDGSAEIRVDVTWTFPLSYAEIISGNGQTVRRKRIDLSQTDSFGEDSLVLDTDLSGQRWVRLEIWDIATNGAFTQPVWLSR